MTGGAPVPDTPRALIADDSNLTRWAIAHALAADGYQVQSACSCDELLEQLLRRHVAVLVTASRLGDRAIGGLLTRVARAWPDTRIVVLCDSEDREAVRRACTQATLVDRPFAVADVVRHARHKNM